MAESKCTPEHAEAALRSLVQDALKFYGTMHADGIIRQAVLNTASTVVTVLEDGQNISVQIEQEASPLTQIHLNGSIVQGNAQQFYYMLLAALEEEDNRSTHAPGSYA